MNQDREKPPKTLKEHLHHKKDFLYRIQEDLTKRAIEERKKEKPNAR